MLFSNIMYADDVAIIKHAVENKRELWNKKPRVSFTTHYFESISPRANNYLNQLLH